MWRVVLAVSGVIAAQVFPTVVEYQAIGKGCQQGGCEGGSVVEVRMIFDKQAAIDDFNPSQGKDLEVTKEGDKVVVNFAYQREIHLAVLPF